jgi:L-alanine-DL-glutamate epimerase-like enolase superfamily enzyme
MQVDVRTGSRPLIISAIVLLAAIALLAVVIPVGSHNVNAWGRAARVAIGALVLLVAMLTYPYGLRDDPTKALVWQTVVTILGLFVLVQGINGWCALRALGVHTPF